MENYFNIKDLKNIVFIGYHPDYEKLIKINKSFEINTIIITSKSQEKNIKKTTRYELFSNLDNKFDKFIKKKVEPNKTLFFSISSRWIFKQNQILNVFNDNLVNFHPSRLPFDAGGGGYSWRILNSDRICNLLIHKVNKNIDSGPIIFSEETIFPRYCKLPVDFYQFQNDRFLNFYERFIKKLKRKDSFKLLHQSDFLGTYLPRLNSENNSWINWSDNSYNLEKFIDAFDDPYDGAKTKINNLSVKIKKVQLHGGEVLNHSFFRGMIIRKGQNWIIVSTSDDKCLIIEEVLNSKKINIIKKLKVGDRFFTPTKYIDEAISKRYFFGSKGLKE